MISYIGKKIHYLTVLRKATKNGRNGFTCKCDCGNIRSFVKNADIVSGSAVSCGCTHTSANFKPIVGNTYGELYVISRLNLKSNDGYLHKCKCSCGKIIVVKYNNLVRFRKTSCGCIKISKKKTILEKLKKHEGKLYGYLEVYDILHDGKKNYNAICMCHGCNAIAIIRETYLTENIKSSCGCKKSELASLAAGGTGIPYESSSLQSLIRSSSQNKTLITTALRNANYTCSISNIKTSALEVHHIASLSSIIKAYGINKNNWTDFEHVLFDSSNLIVLDRYIHQCFHRLYGYSSTKTQLSEFINIATKYLI